MTWNFSHVELQTSEIARGQDGLTELEGFMILTRAVLSKPAEFSILRLELPHRHSCPYIPASIVDQETEAEFYPKSIKHFFMQST